MEVYRYLGLWPAIEKEATSAPRMRMYAPPEGIKPVKTWNLVEYTEPTPANPFVCLLPMFEGV